MVPPNLNYWSISRKESLESQQKHAPKKGLLRTPLCSNYIFNPGFNRKMHMRKKHPFLSEFVLSMNSCFNHYNAPLVEYVNLVQKINLFCQNDWYSVSFDHFHYLRGTNCFSNSTRQY